ncbi:PKHD1L1 [Bugula neritina]|uniref:PKHD1L1 n=1 Tax=Bugula neritina TaxID=10212 RepID=A0A7J7KFB3_BUGNE|nr:PKHD1L1 [Bugula neritina]
MRKRLTHAEGWMCMLLGGETYGLTYENGGQFTNTSNTGKFYDFQEDDYVIMQQQLYQRPDRFRVAGNDESNSSEAELTAANYHGDWYLDDSLLFSYMVSGRDKVEKRSDDYGKSRSINFRVYTCYFNDCIPPPDPNTVPPPKTRPDDAIFWKDLCALHLTTEFDMHFVFIKLWCQFVEKAEVGWGGNNGDGTFGLPVDGTDVKIFNEDWMVLNTQPAELNKIYIYGVLEFEPAQVEGAYIDYKLSATHILLLGGRLFVGWKITP